MAKVPLILLKTRQSGYFIFIQVVIIQHQKSQMANEKREMSKPVYTVTRSTRRVVIQLQDGTFCNHQHTSQNVSYHQ